MKASWDFIDFVCFFDDFLKAFADWAMLQRVYIVWPPIARSCKGVVVRLVGMVRKFGQSMSVNLV